MGEKIFRNKTNNFICENNIPIFIFIFTYVKPLNSLGGLTLSCEQEKLLMFFLEQNYLFKPDYCAWLLGAMTQPVRVLIF